MEGEEWLRNESSCNARRARRGGHEALLPSAGQILQPELLKVALQLSQTQIKKKISTETFWIKHWQSIKMLKNRFHIGGCQISCGLLFQTSLMFNAFIFAGFHFRIKVAGAWFRVWMYCNWWVFFLSILLGVVRLQSDINVIASAHKHEFLSSLTIKSQDRVDFNDSLRY